MAGSSLLSQAKIWAHHEAAVLATLKRALLLLSSRPNLHKAETALRREFYHCLVQAYAEMSRAGELTLSGVPAMQAANPPDIEDEEAAEREKKIPDFLFSYLDHLEENTRAAAKHFTLECKRIGPPDRADWILTRNYATYGVARFVGVSHGYGKGSASGAMVAFVQGLDLAAALAEVNEYLTAEGLPVIPGPAPWTEGAVSSMRQTLTRSFYISPFELSHLWLDIRAQSAAAKAADRDARRMSA